MLYYFLVAYYSLTHIILSHLHQAKHVAPAGSFQQVVLVFQTCFFDILVFQV